MERHILYIGDSHTRAIKNALAENALTESNKNTIYSINVHWLLSEKKDKNVGDLPILDAIEKIKALKKDDLLLLNFLGTAHNIYGLLKHPIPFYLEHYNENSEYEIIPTNLMKAMYLNFILKNKTIDLLIQNCPCKVAHLSTPPPKACNEFISEHSKKYRGIDVNRDSISPAPVRLKMWQLEMEMVKEFCTEKNIDFIPPPQKTLTEDGYLSPEYYNSDATHANTNYGHAVLSFLQEY